MSVRPVHSAYPLSGVIDAGDLLSPCASIVGGLWSSSFFGDTLKPIERLETVTSSLWKVGPGAKESEEPPHITDLGATLLVGLSQLNFGEDNTAKRFVIGALAAKSPADLDDYGDHLLSRILKPHTGEVLIRNIDHLDSLDPKKPIAVVIYPTADHNKAFDAAGFPLLDTLVDSEKFNVLYYETKGPKEAQRIVERIAEKSGRKIHTLILGGHGSSDTLALGTNNCSKEKDKCVTPESFTPIGARNRSLLSLDPYIEEHGQVVLDSCSNGEGGIDNTDNLANSLAIVLPGRRVYAAKISGNYDSLSIRDDLSLRITWSGDGQKSKMYVATSGEIENLQRIKANKAALEQWTKQAIEIAQLEIIHPGTTAKNTPYGRFGLDFERGFCGAKEAVFESHSIPTHDPSEMAKEVRAHIDAFIKKNGPTWTAGAVFEYLHQTLSPTYAMEIYTLYTTGTLGTSQFFRSGTRATLYLPSPHAVAAFPKWLEKLKQTSTGVAPGEKARG